MWFELDTLHSHTHTHSSRSVCAVAPSTLYAGSRVSDLLAKIIVIAYKSSYWKSRSFCTAAICSPSDDGLSCHAQRTITFRRRCASWVIGLSALGERSIVHATKWETHKSRYSAALYRNAIGQVCMCVGRVHIDIHHIRCSQFQRPRPV